MTAPTDPVTRARQLLDAATPGPWEMSEVEATAPHWLTDVFVTDADLGEPVAQILVLDHPDYEVWQPRADANAELIAAAPTLIADLCDIIDQHTDHDLAARLLNMSKNGYDPHPHGVLRAAVRMIGGEA